jgi:peptidoglycan/xylan/chitin deacetylase (PgdA/CDA1 family)
MNLLKRLGYVSLSLQNLAAYLRGQKNIPTKSVVITFDDGYEDNFTHAWPILRETGTAANIFLVTDMIGKSNVWDQNPVGAIRESPLLTEDQIKEMQDGGIFFGSHTANHIDMTKENSAWVREELERSKKRLEDLTRRYDTAFCYPYGRLNTEVKRWVREAGYSCALAGDEGPLKQEADLFNLRRVQVFPGTSLFGFWKKIQSWYPRWVEYQKRVRYKFFKR